MIMNISSPVNNKRVKLTWCLFFGRRKQDKASGHWWLMVEDKYVGYWPRLVIPVLGGGAAFVSWGGEVYSPLNVLSPAMGSGNFPLDAFGVNHGRTAYVRLIKVVIDEKDSTKFEDPNWRLLRFGLTSQRATLPKTLWMKFQAEASKFTLGDQGIVPFRSCRDMTFVPPFCHNF